MSARLEFERETHTVRRELREPVEEYVVACSGEPVKQSLEVVGPAAGLRWQLDGHPDFFSLAEMAKSLQRPGMSDIDKALAAYRFCARYLYGMSMGFGGYEMTRFANCHGYSFCWGQADFLHLLCEAMGLRVRVPQLKGHSSTEVLLDGRWCTLDSFTRSLHPSPDLSGLATGAELREHPELIASVFPEETAGKLADYWSGAGEGSDTYEPRQDSYAMTLDLRRGESLRLDLDRREIWGLAPAEPLDYANGTWQWQAVLDDEHLESETELACGVAAEAIGLRAAAEAEIEYRIHSPYPLLAGTMSLAFDQPTTLEALASRDGRRTRPKLASGTTQEGEWRFDADHMTVGKVPPSTAPAQLEHGAVHELFVRLRWSKAALTRLSFRFDVQAHAKSLPRMRPGDNRWRLIGGDLGATAVHSFETCPGLQTSAPSPLAGSDVTLTAAVHNRGDEPARNVPVQFVQAGTPEVLGETTLAEIAPGDSAAASVVWQATATGDRPAQDSGQPPRYVETRVQAWIAGDADSAAETRLEVLPRPAPQIDAATFYVETVDSQLIVRAALANMPPDCVVNGSRAYLSDSPLTAELRLWRGHPDHGGTLLGEPQRLTGILPAEFKAAAWALPRAELPAQFELYLEVICGEEVAEEDRRLLLGRKV